MNIINRSIEFTKANPDIEILWLYGSRAKGTSSAQSDYDFAVAFKSMKEGSLEQRLAPVLLAREWADALKVEDKIISIIDINHIPLPLAQSVINTGKVLHCKNGERLAREENRIRGMWEEYLREENYHG